jgi:aminoglycoside phosphotransferase (APT) family kinase protein
MSSLGRNAEGPPPESLAWVREQIGRGSRVASVAYLEGSSFLRNHAIDVVDSAGIIHRLVLRRWAEPGWEATDREFDAEREAAILDLLARSEVPAPRLVGADPRGERTDVPAVLMTRLPGRSPPDRPPDLESFLLELATVLEAIHSVDGRAAEVVPAYRRYHEPRELSVPSWAEDASVWRRAIAVAREAPPAGRECFIHRDFHPGNTLWSGGRITGVVDWSYGSWGSPAIDLAHLRWNIALDFGVRGAEQALAAHRKVRGAAVDHHPYWDLVDVLDLVADIDPSDPLPRDERDRLDAYVSAVLKSL